MSFVYKFENANSKEAQLGLDWIIANQKKEWKQIDVYEWYYHAQACQATGVSGGSKYWRAWNKEFQQIVCGGQASDGHWPHGKHFHGDTDIYRTTMTILMLKYIIVTCLPRKFNLHSVFA